MKKSWILSALMLSGMQYISGQQLTLLECIEKAKENNPTVKIARQSLETREKLAQSDKNNMLPKVDLLAGYNYLGEPIQVNLQQVKESIVEGTANQSVYSASTIYQQITGQPLSQQIQDIIYQTSKDIIGAVYPTYNPTVAKQSYFLAGVMVRQPIYLGGKLKASQELSAQQLESGKVNVESSEDLITYNISLQYIQVLFYNTMIQKQEEMVNSLKKNVDYANNLMTAEILVPYQKNWANVALTQGETMLSNLKLERENALLTLKELMGLSLSDHVEISGVISEETMLPTFSDQENNADVRLLESKKKVAETAFDVTKSLSKPNIFAIGNVQFFRKDLPLITPPWMVGIEMQWTLFDPERKSKVLASESLVKEADLLINQKQSAVNLATKIAENKLKSISEQSASLDEARQQTYTTTDMVRKRMENSLSSIKDVNDALQLQYQAEKMYYTSLVAYQTALATYYYISGNPENIIQYIP